MARAIDLFIDHPADDEHQLVVRVGTAVHCPPVATTDGRWEVRLADGVIAHLGRHCFVDDVDLPLRGYPWTLAARIPDGPGLLEHPATAALRAVAEELRHGGTRALLVLDLQRRVPLGGRGPAVATAAPHPTGEAPGDPGPRDLVDAGARGVGDAGGAPDPIVVAAPGGAAGPDGAAVPGGPAVPGDTAGPGEAAGPGGPAGPGGAAAPGGAAGPGEVAGPGGAGGPGGTAVPGAPGGPGGTGGRRPAGGRRAAAGRGAGGPGAADAGAPAGAGAPVDAGEPVDAGGPADAGAPADAEGDPGALAPADAGGEAR